MTRAKKIKEVAEEVKHEEVEGQTSLPFVEEVPEQTEEVEEVLTAKDFPHQQKGKGGRPLSTDKKIQMKLYVTKDLKIDMELKGEVFGKTSSQFIESVMSKILDMSDKELAKFLELEIVSDEERRKIRQHQESRKQLAEKIKDKKLNLLRKQQFSLGKFSPAEILETFAYVNLNLTDQTDKYYPSNTKLKELMLAKNFRIEEYIRVTGIINKVVNDYCKFNAVHTSETIPNLWKIENFYGENITALKINSKAKKMTVSADNNFFKLLLGE
jgi:hypothetical protein